eukprot:2369866-Pyramimonas_sp.AAC.1
MATRSQPSRCRTSGKLFAARGQPRAWGSTSSHLSTSKGCLTRRWQSSPCFSRRASSACAGPRGFC